MEEEGHESEMQWPLEAGNKPQFIAIKKAGLCSHNYKKNRIQTTWISRNWIILEILQKGTEPAIEEHKIQAKLTHIYVTILIRFRIYFIDYIPWAR